MEFKEGQPVVVRKNLGSESGHGRGNYFSGISLKDVPLGSRGVIKGLESNRYLVRIAGEVYAFVPNEIKLDESAKETDKIGSLLEETLVVAIDPIKNNVAEAGVVAPSVPREGLVGLFSRVRDYFIRKPELPKPENPFRLIFSSEKKSELPQSGEYSFQPKFNAREEFAVWMRQQFPDLPSSKSFIKYDYHGGEGSIYYPGSFRFPKERRGEIYEAAKLACKHGIRTAEGCTQAYFRYCLDRLDKKFDEAVFTLVNLIENVSANLPHEKIHYGTSKVRRK